MKRISKNLKQRWVVGAIIEIDLMDGTFTYAQLLESPKIQFYNIKRSRLEECPSFDKILESSKIFQLSVYPEAVRSEWLRLGKVCYDSEKNVYPSKYTIDSITDAITIWKAGGGTYPGTIEDIKGLEYLAVWEYGAVEQRLRDHFAGRPCWYMESDKPGWKRISAKEFYAQYGYDFNWLDDD